MFVILPVLAINTFALQSSLVTNESRFSLAEKLINGCCFYLMDETYTAFMIF